MAVPFAVAKLTATVPGAVGESVTVKIALVVPALPSVTVTSLMDSAGPEDTVIGQVPIRVMVSLPNSRPSYAPTVVPAVKFNVCGRGVGTYWYGAMGVSPAAAGYTANQSRFELPPVTVIGKTDPGVTGEVGHVSGPAGASSLVIVLM